MACHALEWEETGKIMDYRYGFNTYHYFNPEKVLELSPKIEPKPVEKKADDFDLFGNDDAPAPVPVKKVEPKAKKVVIAKSIVVFDVKVFEEEQDLNALANRIYDISIDGLVWNKEHKILPIAYGMNKLQIGCVVEDDKVGTDDIFDKIQAWEDEVQSVDIVTFQKV